MAAPPDTHLHLVRLAAGHGVDVIVEKPLYARLAQAEDVVTGVLDYGHGRQVALHATIGQFPGRDEELTVAGTTGTAVLTGSRLVRYPGAEVIVAGTAASASADPSALPVEWHQALIEDAVEAFDEDREPLASGRSALVTQRVIDTVYQSGARGGWVDVDQR